MANTIWMDDKTCRISTIQTQSVFVFVFCGKIHTQIINQIENQRYS